MNTVTSTLLTTTFSASLLLSLPTIALAIPQKWQLDVPKTNVDFEVAYFGSASVKGQFHDIDGAINYDVKYPARTNINFTVKSSSVDTGSKIRDSFLRRKELLNTAPYPAMTFASKKVTMITPKEANVTGDFTALGQTKPLTVRVTLSDAITDPSTKKSTLKFKATGLVDRYDYGVTTFSNMVGTKIPLVIAGELVPAN